MKQKMISSRIISNETGKRHDHVIRDIRVLINKRAIDLIINADPNLGLLNDEPFCIESEYFDAQNKPRIEFLLNGFACEVLSTTYDPVNARKLIKLVKELKKMVEKPIDFSDANAVLRLAQNYAEEQNKRIEAENKVKELKPKAEFMERAMGSEDKLKLDEVAKVLKLPYGRNKLIEKLRSFDILTKRGQYNIPVQKYVDKGFFSVKEEINDVNGKTRVSLVTMTNQKGLNFIAQKLNLIMQTKMLLD